MKKVSVDFNAEFGTVIDYEMTDEQYEIYKNGNMELSEILGHDIFEDALNDYEEFGFDSFDSEVIEVEDIDDYDDDEDADEEEYE